MSLSPCSDTDLWISWDTYHKLIDRLALTVHQSGWEFDQILCLARGGLRVGDILSRIFQLPLAILSTSSYREGQGTVQGHLNISQYITMPKDKFFGRVLLVDDLVDSGVTLQAVKEHLAQHYKAVTEIKTAVLWYKACSKIKPDFFVDFLPHNPWIHQPFEQYDTLTPAQLEQRSIVEKSVDSESLS